MIFNPKYLTCYIFYKIRNMINVLLISEDYIKTNSSLNENFWGKNLLPAIREAQDIYLQSIIGTCLYHRLLDMVDNGTVSDSENIAYKDLLDDKILPYLLYRTLANVIPLANVKITNFGTTISQDEKLVGLNQTDTDLTVNYYEDKADWYAKRLQKFLKSNYEAFPELKNCGCGDIKPNLDSAAGSSLWLGGYRGRVIKPTRKCDC